MFKIRLSNCVFFNFNDFQYVAQESKSAYAQFILYNLIEYPVIYIFRNIEINCLSSSFFINLYLTASHSFFYIIFLRIFLSPSLSFSLFLIKSLSRSATLISLSTLFYFDLLFSSHVLSCLVFSSNLFSSLYFLFPLSQCVLFSPLLFSSLLTSNDRGSFRSRRLGESR